MTDDTTEVTVATEFFDAGESTYRRRGETFETDDPDAFGDLVEPASEASDAEREALADDSADSEETEPPFDPGEYTVPELESRMADSDHTDAEREALADAERNGENRNSAIGVLEA